MRNIIILLCCLSLLLCGGCRAAEPLSRDTVAFDTPCTVTLYDGGSEELLDACMKHLAQRDDLWSRTKTDSDVCAVNAQSGQWVTVDIATARLLRTAASLSSQTDGAFDITTLPLTRLWENAQTSGVAPSKEELDAALATVGYQQLTLNGNDVKLSGGSIDLGAIAKGYVADELRHILKEGGCTSAIISLGGNAVVIGEKPNGQPFHVGIADPRNDSELIATVAVRDCSVVTSGSYIRGYTVAGKRYSHILDPKTGQPVDNDLLSVTILCFSSVEADAMSTACFVMGFDKAKAFIEKTDGVEAVFVKADGSVVATAGVTFA